MTDKKETGGELVLLSSAPAKIEFNLKEFHDGIKEELKAYDLVVTVDTIKGAKLLAADLNKKAADLKGKFKEVSVVVSKPINDIGEEIKAIVSDILESREKLTVQIKKFEDERKVTVKEVLTKALHDLWLVNDVDEAFQNASIDSIVKLTAISDKDKITSSTKREIQSLVDADKRLQSQTENRLLTLENQSYKAGLKSPLTRDHVEGFLFANDEQYQANLGRMIESEINRQAAIVEAVQAEQVSAVVMPQIDSAGRDGVTPDIELAISDNGAPISSDGATHSDFKPDAGRIGAINAHTGRALMGLGLSKAQASKVMELAYNGELYGLKMIYGE